MESSKEHTEFIESLKKAFPKENWPLHKKALWWIARGDWNRAHNIAQDLDTPLGSWIHAYLHRLEGDRFNSGYWYRLAKKPYPEESLEKEFEFMLIELL
ncbi:MAG: hypothetical protein WBN11_11625 [Eudoraea sp.]|uniref:hypothetical protein n=1 Tax=Eudoraea sp. TaxID=1979955 RepID=UPI003C707F14